MKKNKKEKEISEAQGARKGREGFVNYYSQVYGQRWTSLQQALMGEQVYVRLEAGGIEPYFLDPGSVCAPLCLPLNEGGRILDLCAAPGGKTLVLASIMPQDASLSSNERSGDRKARLARVVSQCLPESVSSRVLVSCSDGATWCRRETESFDRILLDVPCSSERHVLMDEKYLNEWSASRIKSISMEQWALISSAWRLLKQDGYMVYSTCALAPQENDCQLQRLLKKFPDAELVQEDRVKEIFASNLELISPKIQLQESPQLENIFEKAERTESGWHVLPDTDFGAGPLYFSLIHKKMQP